MDSCWFLNVSQTCFQEGVKPQVFARLPALISHHHPWHGGSIATLEGCVLEVSVGKFVTGWVVGNSKRSEMIGFAKQIIYTPSVATSGCSRIDVGIMFLPLHKMCGQHVWLSGCSCGQWTTWSEFCIPSGKHIQATSSYCVFSQVDLPIDGHVLMSYRVL